MTQKQLVLEWLQKNGSITPLEALSKLGVYRLSDVIFKLREKFEIETVKQVGVNRFNEPVRYAKYVYLGKLYFKERR